MRCGERRHSAFGHFWEHLGVKRLKKADLGEFGKKSRTRCLAKKLYSLSDFPYSIRQRRTRPKCFRGPGVFLNS